MGQAGEIFDFPGVGVLGGVDLAEPLVEGGGFLLAGGGVLGGGGGEPCGEHGGAVGSEHMGGEELVDDGEQVVFADSDGARVVGGRGGVGGVFGVVRAPVYTYPGWSGWGRTRVPVIRRLHSRHRHRDLSR